MYYKTIEVNIVPLNEIAETQVYKESVVIKSLTYWQEAQQEFFTKKFAIVGRTFNSEMDIVCEEFTLDYLNSKINM